MTAEALAAPKPVKWWFPLVQGILSIVVGLLFLMQPVATSKTAFVLLCLYLLILVILDLFILFRYRTALGWKLFMLAQASIKVPSTVKCSSDRNLFFFARSTTLAKKSLAISDSRSRSRFLVKVE